MKNPIIQLGPIHEDVLDLVFKNPGLTTEQVHNKSVMVKDIQQAARILQSLVSGGGLKRIDGKYYPIDLKVEPVYSDVRDQFKSPPTTIKLSPKQQKIIDSLPEDGITADDLCLITGQTKDSLQVMMVEIRKKGLVSSVRREGKNYYVKTQQSAAPVKPVETPPLLQPVKDEAPTSKSWDTIHFEGLLKKNLTDAETNVQKYIESCCDQNTLLMLQARVALAMQLLEVYSQPRTAK